jgi:hypothetical protein
MRGPLVGKPLLMVRAGVVMGLAIAGVLRADSALAAMDILYVNRCATTCTVDRNATSWLTAPPEIVTVTA